MTRKKTIAILHYTAPSVVGGVEAVMAAHAELLIENGYAVKYVVGRGAESIKRIPTVEIPLIDSKNDDIIAVGDELETGSTPKRFHKLKDQIKSELENALSDADVCIVHNAFTLHKNMPMVAAFHELISGGISTKLIAWCHDVAWSNPLYIPKLRDEYPFTLLKAALPEVTYVTVSELRRAEMADTMGLDPGEIQVVPNGISMRKFLKLSPTGWQIAKEYRLLERDPVLLLPARITKRKNIELAIRITRSLLDMERRPLLIVTGPPGPHNVKSYEYVDFLRDLRKELDVEKEVVFLYERKTKATDHFDVSDSVIADLYRLADCLLFPSSQEGFGIPIIEAGLARLPVFCSDIPPFREIADGKADFFRLEDPPDEIATRILSKLEADHTSLLLRHVLRNYTWASIFEQQIKPLL